jgi:N-methylhydantoinase A
VDDHGVLKVGPESAGSNPGPACYGRGGTQPTITDAYAVCGFLGGGELGYGAVKVDLDLARNAVSSAADRMGLSVEQTAEAIIKVSISGMFLEVSKLFSRHGADPRSFSLLPFGGAGPMTACLLARDLGMQRIIVPPVPGVLAAYGGLVADIRNDFIRTAFVEVDADGVAALAGHVRALEAQGRAWLRDEQRFSGEPKLSWSADMRYRGQSYEIEVPVERAWIDEGNLDALRQAFHREHERVYEHADEKAIVQAVNLRLVATGTAPRPQTRQSEPVDRPATAIGETRVFFDGDWHVAKVFDRARLVAGEHLTGPAVVRQDDCTTCLVRGYTATVDPHLNLIIERTA